jgi:hypothetical protein
MMILFNIISLKIIMSAGGFYLNKNEDGLIAPTSQLDHLLVLEDEIKDVTLYYLSIFTGEVVTKENYPELVKKVKENIANKVYETTDHLPMKVIHKGITYIYVSLDNSVRANTCGASLYKRIENICDLLRDNINEKTVVFFSEACRPSFDGDDRVKRPNEVSWFQMRQTICQRLKLIFLGEKANNDDSNQMAFGVAAFATKSACELIHSVLPRQILFESIGSGCLGIKTIKGDIIWGIHAPLDFKGVEDRNLGVIGVRNLINMMKEHKGSCFAIGDFNTIPGPIAEVIKRTIPDDMKMINNPDIMTFFAAFGDVLLPRSDEVWLEYQ